MQGWIKLHRKALGSAVFAKPVVWKVWCWCLLKASHTKYKLPFGDKDMEIEVGQFVTGRNKASLELGLTPQQYRTAIKYLKLTNRITIKTTNKFSIISVKNWESYQLVEAANQQTNQPVTNQQPASNQPVTTYKKVKKDKNVKKRIFTPPTLEDVNQYISEKGYSVDGKKFFEYFNESGWVDSRGNKVKNWKQKIITWENHSGNGNGKTPSKKIKLFPIAGRTCGKDGCVLPAVYKCTSGNYDSFACGEHMPAKVKEKYEC